MGRACRSSKLKQQHLEHVKQSLSRKGFATQEFLAIAAEVHSATVSNFLNGKPVDTTNAMEICHQLSQDFNEVCISGNETAEALESLETKAIPELENAPQAGALVPLPPVLEVDYVDADADAGADADKVEASSTEKISQEMGTLAGIAVGHTQQVTVNSDLGAAQSAQKGDTSAKTEAKKPKSAEESKSIEVKQSANEVTETGILIGITRQLNIPSKD